MGDDHPADHPADPSGFVSEYPNCSQEPCEDCEEPCTSTTTEEGITSGVDKPSHLQVDLKFSGSVKVDLRDLFMVLPGAWQPQGSHGQDQSQESYEDEPGVENDPDVQ